MGLAVYLLLLATPAFLVMVVADLLLRRNALLAKRFMWSIVVVTWAASVAIWAIYSGQQDDVGLMVYGIMGWASAGSAALATLTAVVLQWRG